MAVVRLGRFEVEQRRLPPICMACGAPAALHKSKRFAWHPQWVWVLLLAGLLPLLIVAAILTKRMTAAVPLCANHKRYFLLRNVALPLSLVLFLGLGCAGLLGVSDLERQAGGDWTSLYGLAFAAAFLGWVIFAAVVGQRSIRPTEITDRSMTLVHVSEEFAEAIQRSRISLRDEDAYPEVLPVHPRELGRGDTGQFYDPKR